MDAASGVMNASSAAFAAPHCVFHVISHDVTDVTDAAARSASEVVEPLRSGEGGAALSKCSRCHEARYCSRECQIKDFPRHKKVCKK
jgi:cytochrome c553